ncbi:MAG: hypothetical protein WD934_01100 [Gemmatimonadales bacterium]
MVPRREFLTSAGAVLGAVASRHLAAQMIPAVEAIPTVFHGHPDGTRTLIRLVVRNSDAPAGRLRVYDERTNALLGTAGVISVGDGRLSGELWLPLERPLRVRTELEYPGTQRPLRDRFTLTPTPRWTLHWLLLADPASITATLATLDAMWRGVPVAALRDVGAQIDPVRHAEAPTDLAAARIVWPAWMASRASGLPLAPVGTALRGFAGLPSVLAGSGLTGTVGMLDEPWTVVDQIPASLADLQRLVEERLVANDAPLHRGFVVTPIHQDTDGLAALFDAWRTRFTAPVLAVGTAPADMRTRGITMLGVALPGGPDALAERAAQRRDALESEGDSLFAPLASPLGASGNARTAIANAIRSAYAGTIVFNATSFGRTDVVRAGDGEWIATDIPGPGYAVVPTPAPITWPEPTTTAPPVIANITWRVRLTERGTISSLLHQPSGTELAGTHGLMVASDARAMDIGVTRVRAFGERLVVRHVAGGSRWTTTFTLYNGLDTLDVQTDGGPWDHAWRFDAAVGGTRTRWAELLGMGQADGAMHGVSAGDWWAADGTAGSLMVACPDGAVLSRDADGVLRHMGPSGGLRLRLAFAGTALADDPWRIGALGHPLIALPIPGTGSNALPGFGRVLNLRDPGTRLVGLRPADDGHGVIAYLHDIMGVARPITLQSDLHTIRTAYACDLLERDRAVLTVQDGAVTVELVADGVVAVRLILG